MTSQHDELLLLFDSVKTRYGQCLEEFKEDERYIKAPWDKSFGQEIIPEQWEDEGLEVTAPPTIYNAVENAADHILSVPRITVPVRPTQTEIEKQNEIAEKRRAFHEMWWHRVFEDDGDPLGRGKKSLIKGKLVLKKELKWDLLPILPENATTKQKASFRRQLERVGKSAFIWRLRVIPKETVFEDPSSPWDPQWLFESYETTVMEARSRYQDNERIVELLRDRDPLTKIQYLEYWCKPHGSSPGEYVQWIERERCHEGINPYSWETPLSTEDSPQFDGYVPYVIGDPGWGDSDAEAKPEDRYVSIVRPIRSVGKAETRFLTEMESYLRMYVWPHLLTKNMPDLTDGEKQIHLGPGGHTDLTEDQSAEVLKWGEMPVSLLQGMERVNQYADEASRFGVLGGIPQRGVDTATEADQNVRNAATKLSGPVRALRRMVIQINKWILQDIEKVLEAPVTIYGALEHGPSEVTLTPREIGGYYSTNVEMETSDEASLNLRNARTWSDLAQRMPISFRTAMNKAGVQNPSAEMEERMVEDLERSPQAQQVAMLMFLAGLGEGGQMVRQAFQQTLMDAQAASGGATGQGLMPPAQPNMIDQGRAQARDSAMQAAPERAMY